MRKFFVCIVLILFCLSSAVSTYADNKLPVLMYHNITEDESLVETSSSVQITPKVFEEHLIALKEAGYTTISLKEYYNHCLNGAELPKKPIIITFDDGYVSNYVYAYPLLKKYNQKAAIFVIASRMGANDVEFPHFTWEEAIEMEESGYIEIESHSFNHPDFSTISNMSTILEMRLSKYAIDLNLNKDCKFFAYPYGQVNGVSAKVAELAGYKMVFVGGNISANKDGADLYTLPRYTVYGSCSPDELINMIQ